MPFILGVSNRKQSYCQLVGYIYIYCFLCFSYFLYWRNSGNMVCVCCGEWTECDDGSWLVVKEEVGLEGMVCLILLIKCSYTFLENVYQFLFKAWCPIYTILTDVMI